MPTTRTIMIKENLSLDNSNSIIHVITVGDNPSGGWYRQVGASEGMIERSAKRWFNHWHNKKFNTHDSQIRFDRWRKNDEQYYLNRRTEFLANKTDINNEMIKFYPKLIKKHHDSVWDFFNSINYCHKDKTTKNTDTLILIREKPNK